MLTDFSRTRGTRPETDSFATGVIGECDFSRDFSDAR
jgi:hypothetical protein